MATTASEIIDEHGGTSVVARLLHAPVSTVHSWRAKGRIPPSRLAHLRLAAAAVQVEEHDGEHATVDSAPGLDCAPGKSGDLAAPAQEEAA